MFSKLKQTADPVNWM